MFLQLGNTAEEGSVHFPDTLYQGRRLFGLNWLEEERSQHQKT